MSSPKRCWTRRPPLIRTTAGRSGFSLRATCSPRIWAGRIWRRCLCNQANKLLSLSKRATGIGDDGVFLYAFDLIELDGDELHRSFRTGCTLGVTIPREPPVASE